MAVVIGEMCNEKRERDISERQERKKREQPALSYNRKSLKASSFWRSKANPTNYPLCSARERECVCVCVCARAWVCVKLLVAVLQFKKRPNTQLLISPAVTHKPTPDY